MFDESFDYAGNPEDRKKYKPNRGAHSSRQVRRREDAVAYVSFLDAQRQVDRNRKVGTHGYCLGGPYVLKTAAALARSCGRRCFTFHSGFLVTDKRDSPHFARPENQSTIVYCNRVGRRPARAQRKDEPRSGVCHAESSNGD